MNVSVVMARIAGTESTAKMMSTIAIATQRRGAGETAGCSRLHALDQRLLGAVVVAVAEHPPARPDQERGEHEAQPAERAASAAAPATMKTARRTSASDDAVGQQPVALGGRRRRSAVKTSRKTKTLSSESDFSTR